MTNKEEMRHANVMCALVCHYEFYVYCPKCGQKFNIDKCQNHTVCPKCEEVFILDGDYDKLEDGFHFK